MTFALTSPSLYVTCGNIVEQKVDAIVNAANPTLLGGGGVDGAIHRAGGKRILDACKILRQSAYPDGLPVGEAVATEAGLLPARFIIHTVGPIWRGGTTGEKSILRRCYINCLRLATELGVATIAFPAISTGAYGFPKETAFRISTEVVLDYIKEHPNVFEEIRFVLFSDTDYRLYSGTIDSENKSK